MIKRAHIKLIALHSTRYSIRGGVGLVFLMMALTFGLLVAHIMLTPVEQATRKAALNSNAEHLVLAKQVVDGHVQSNADSVRWMLGASEIEEITDIDAQTKRLQDLDQWTHYLLQDNPALLSGIMLILLWGWPMIISCGAFDLFSGDMANRGLRYQLLRTDRGSIFIGRFLGMALTFSLVLGLLMSTVVLYIGLKLPIYSWGDLVAWGAQGLGAMVIVTLPYMALCSWVSASIASSFGSLTIGMLIIGGVPLMAVLGRAAHETAGNLMYALPWGFQHYLLHHNLTTSIAAIVGCLGFTALFFFLGFRRFVTRDL